MDDGVASDLDGAFSPAPTWLARLRGRLTSRWSLGGAYALACILTGVAVWLASSAPLAGLAERRSLIILSLLGFNLVIILALVASVGWRFLKLVAVQHRDAGARLHLRFVLWFASGAIAPAVIITLVFGVLVNQTVDSWFSQRVHTVVENGRQVARSYFNSQINSIRDDVDAIDHDLSDPNAIALFGRSPILFGQKLALEGNYRNFPAVYLIDHEGRILSRFEADPAYTPFLAPPPSTIAASADPHTVSIEPFIATNLIRAVVRLGGYDDAYLYVVRPVDPGILSRLGDTEKALAAYEDTAQNRGRVEAASGLSLLEVTLLLLVAAVWIGMAAASAISAPVARLIHAADRVAAGDLTARVAVHHEPDEIADLSRSFNRMAGDLEAQQSALRAAGDEAEARTRFIETVLAGVSAGVIGLDGEGRISALNRQAIALLNLSQQTARGQTLAEAAPELVDLAAEAAGFGGDAEAEIDISRGAESHRLRVRASGHADGGLVLTFDDITRLVTAQRNAAWRDVARRIAHEIKNPLTPIQLSAERIRRKYRGDIKGDLETFDRCTETIIRQVGDIGRMVDEFSAFARMPAPKFTRMEPAELLRQAVFAQRVVDPATTIDLAEILPDAVMLCDGPMIGQALTNLLKNAGEAIAARRATEPKLKGHIAARLVLGDGDLAFEIEDNGVGLPAKGRDRLFEPYVTTREKGTGLGLAIVKRIVEDHGGELALSDAKEKPGARVTLRLPRIRNVERANAEGVSAA
jgi:two-component system, NtrC family, nitrogen regulation sensor histidine kinase NtrY